ncbi:uncharacterized protein I206_100270 [Kwoniella pini CBS 10737]|uniref:ornithine decarboxylase n=1 Tax=Kwoniella pini CBS 10737 TaxID=1296096 RepID=A0A1B9IDI2_9TREE|nr:ornithine decarboxylase [Kwoniella pini CBS 10737]OCF53748.1 ornithine decarboxylase [Kwoniella pini CBS 10737]
MAATTVKGYMTPTEVAISQEQTTWAEQHDIQTRSSVNDLVKVLDPSAKLPYLASKTLPTPPRTIPQSVCSYDEEHPALSAQVHEKSVHALIQEIITQKAEAQSDETEDESAFFACDLSAIYQSYLEWKASPIGNRVEIFYATKCNPSPQVLHLLSLLGTSFDCASMSEINAVLSLPSAPSPDRIIFANPCKPASFIKNAAQKGLKMMTFDNADELYKIKRIYPTAKLVLRILTDDSKSLCRLGLKFGAPLSTCPGLLSLAKQLGLDVIGVSFHVGSGCKDPMQFADAVWRARKAFDMGKSAGYDFNLLDIGGGFERETFQEMTQVLSDSFDLYFPEDSGVRIIAEPGRFMVSSAFTLATSIIASRRAQQPGEEALAEPVEEEEKTEGAADVMYYINEGVYGSFNCIMFDHQIVHPHPLTIKGELMKTEPPFPPLPNVAIEVDLPIQMGYNNTESASVWGPTCDSIDCVRQLVDLPKGMDVGDWVGWTEMGAYTLCAASTFNGFDKSPVHWTTGNQTKPESKFVKRLLEEFNSTSLR